MSWVGREAKEGREREKLEEGGRNLGVFCGGGIKGKGGTGKSGEIVGGKEDGIGEKRE